jgi:hypothetical protein
MSFLKPSHVSLLEGSQTLFSLLMKNPADSRSCRTRSAKALQMLKVAFNTITLNPLYCGSQMINWWGNRRWNTWKKTTELLKVSDNFDFGEALIHIRESRSYFYTFKIPHRIHIMTLYLNTGFHVHLWYNWQFRSPIDMFFLFIVSLYSD